VPERNRDGERNINPSTSSGSTVSSETKRIPALVVPKAPNISTRRPSPNHVLRRVSRTISRRSRSRSRRPRSRDREIRRREKETRTLEERDKIFKLLPGLENWQDYTINDIKYEKRWWNYPQCGE